MEENLSAEEIGYRKLVKAVENCEEEVQKKVLEKYRNI